MGFGSETVPEKINLLFTRKKIDPAPGSNIRSDYLALVEEWAGKKASLNLASPLVIKEASPSIPIEELPILVAPGSRWANKKLPQSKMVAFLKEIQSETPATFYLLYGSPEEKKECEVLASQLSRVYLCPPMPLAELPHFMQQMDHVIAMDSLPLHLAAAANVPTFSLFGASQGRKYAPSGAGHHHIQGPCPYNLSFEKRCPLLRRCPTGACIRDLSMEDLRREYHHFIQKKSKIS